MEGLNPQQYEAATDIESKLVLVLAGPGSGKTHVLAKRIGYLVGLQFHIKAKAWSVLVLTFTNKAANEMKERIHKTAGLDACHGMNIGTFHSVASIWLRKYGSLIGLDDKFVIADSSKSLSILKKIIKSFEKPDHIDIKPGVAQSEISKAKSRQQNPDAYEALHENNPIFRNYYGPIYRMYEQELRKSKLLDFDDLLLYGLRLVQRCPEKFGHYKWIHVDEFQDTNTIQYELISALSKAAPNANLFVVGDPDQYVTNTQHLREDFPDARIVKLEQNYRSTQAILNCSLHVIRQAENRIDKELFTQNNEGMPVVLTEHHDAQAEATHVAREIKHLVEISKGTLRYRDFAILIRTAMLSQPVEQALTANKIPYNVRGAQAFFERAEIKDLLSYLVLLENPNDEAAFLRAINTPKREIGDKSQEALVEAAKANNTSYIDIVKTLAKGGKVKEISRCPRAGITKFVEVYEAAEKMLQEGAKLADIIQRIYVLTKFEDHLKLTYKLDWEDRIGHIQQLKTYAARFDTPDEAPSASQPQTQEDTLEFMSLDKSPLAALLETTTLSRDLDAPENEADDDPKLNKVSISTMHASKGLEWPVVFIIGVEDNIIPHIRSQEPHQVEEERRLFYVSMTRAKAFLFLSHAKSRLLFGNPTYNDLTPFLNHVPEESCVEERPMITKEMWSNVATLLGRVKDGIEWEDEKKGDMKPAVPIPRKINSNAGNQFTSGSQFGNNSFSGKYAKKPLSFGSNRGGYGGGYKSGFSKSNSWTSGKYGNTGKWNGGNSNSNWSKKSHSYNGGYNSNVRGSTSYTTTTTMGANSYTNSTTMTASTTVSSLKNSSAPGFIPTSVSIIGTGAPLGYPVTAPVTTTTTSTSATARNCGTVDIDSSVLSNTIIDLTGSPAAPTATTTTMTTADPAPARKSAAKGKRKRTTKADNDFVADEPIASYATASTRPKRVRAKKINYAEPIDVDVRTHVAQLIEDHDDDVDEWSLTHDDCDSTISSHEMTDNHVRIPIINNACSMGGFMTAGSVMRNRDVGDTNDPTDEEHDEDSSDSSSNKNASRFVSGFTSASAMMRSRKEYDESRKDISGTQQHQVGPRHGPSMPARRSSQSNWANEDTFLEEETGLPRVEIPATKEIPDEKTESKTNKSKKKAKKKEDPSNRKITDMFNRGAKSGKDGEDSNQVERKPTSTIVKEVENDAADGSLGSAAGKIESSISGTTDETKVESSHASSKTTVKNKKVKNTKQMEAGKSASKKIQETFTKANQRTNNPNNSTHMLPSIQNIVHEGISSLQSNNGRVKRDELFSFVHLVMESRTMTRQAIEREVKCELSVLEKKGVITAVGDGWVVADE